MKTLIVPDIHTHWEKADKLLKSQEYDQAVLLGDYFDEFYDTVEDNVKTAEWLKTILDDPKITCLMGNHDYAYWKNEWCSGNTIEKREAINKVLTDEDFKKLQIMKVVDGWALTHAGLDSRWSFSQSLWLPFSPLWVRPDNFIPAQNDQIFGHTEFSYPWSNDYGNYRQVCLDTRRQNYGVIDSEAKFDSVSRRGLTIHPWLD